MIQKTKVKGKIWEKNKAKWPKSRGSETNYAKAEFEKQQKKFNEDKQSFEREAWRRPECMRPKNCLLNLQC